MEIGRIFDILAAIVSVALAFVLVTSPQTANIISTSGTAFATSLRAAMGH